MIVSMTGFGDATAERGGTRYAVEVRSLNNRYFKPVIKLPDAVSGLEPELESMLRERLGRGSITYILKMRTEAADGAPTLNTAVLKGYLDQLQAVKGLDRLVQIDLAGLVTLPGVIQGAPDAADDLATHAPIVRELTRQAVERLDAFRRREGQTLFDELMRQVTVIRTSLKEIAAMAPGVVEDYYRRLQERVNKLLAQASVQVSQVDLIKEVAVYAEKADIAEEITRLGAHTDAFEQGCRTGEHAGRKLDFIAQEMLREANTIAAKANDARIAKLVVDIKGAIDRVKEQVQNVE
ncbi:MAG TPA: YicC/YloC family endoribonuclease [Humisphaera sp.]